MRLWERGSLDQAARPLRVLTGPTSPVRVIAISPDGTWLAAGGGETVHTWAADGTARAVLHHPSFYVKALAIAPDGTRLVTVGAGASQLWAADGAPRGAPLDLYSPNSEGWREAEVEAVAISPDGSWLATVGSSGPTLRTRWAHLWGADGRPIATLNWAGAKGWPIIIRGGAQIGVHVRSVIAIAPGGTWLATAGSATVRLWNADGTSRATLSGHRRPVRAIGIAPDGTWLATGAGRMVRLWNADGTSRATLGHPRPVCAMAIAPDGTWLATAHSRSVRLWDTGA